jgi:sugar/nucleoside kinase (ribokinase family)
MARPRVVVFGPAYLDRVLRVDRPLVDASLGPPLDQSVEGQWKFGAGPALEIVSPDNCVIAIDLPPAWPGPRGQIQLARPLPAAVPARLRVRGVEWYDDLGGMGAGYAAALGGLLCCALGDRSDASSQAICHLLERHDIEYRPMHVPGHPADWTLLVTSGEFGDKLPIGFRGACASLDAGALDALAALPSDLRVVASLPNRLAERALRAPGAGMRLFAPAVRNVSDRDCTISSFAGAIDILSCNRTEWELLEDREQVAWQVSILIVTEGAAGSTVRFTTPQGEPGLLHVPAFPRTRPPRDTNRAGEAFAATLTAALLDAGWQAGSGVISQDLARSAAERASAAAALVIDRTSFGFPTGAEIDAALGKGCVD